MKKQISTKLEKELSNMIGFKGIYVSSLIKAAQKNAKGETVNELLKSYKAQNKEAVKALARSYFMNPAEYKRLTSKAHSILECFSTAHSMGCYRTLALKIKGKYKTFTTNHTLDTYAGNKWKPTYGNIVIYMTKSQLKRIENIEGVWTIVNEDGTATWLEGTGWKSAYVLQWVKGYVSGTTHSEKSLADAEAGEAIKLQSAINAIKNDSRFVGYDHIRATGACDAGIKAFCERHRLSIENGYNLGFLKSLEKTQYFEKVQEI